MCHKNSKILKKWFGKSIIIGMNSKSIQKYMKCNAQLNEIDKNFSYQQ